MPCGARTRPTCLPLRLPTAPFAYALAHCPNTSPTPGVVTPCPSSCVPIVALQVWDIKSPRPVHVIPAHASEVLTLDWNKYRPNVVATGSVDTSIRVRCLVRAAVTPLRPI